METILKTINKENFKEYGIDNSYDIYSLLDLEKQQINDGSSAPDKKKPNKRRDSSGLTMRSRNKLAKDTGRIVKGFAGTIQKDRVNDIIPIETFIGARKDLLKRGSSTVFFNHDTNIPIGIVSETAINKDNGLFVEFFISKANDVDDIWKKIEEGILNSLSIRLQPEEIDIKENKKTGEIEAMVIKKMKLMEVSVVGIPANPGATVTDVISKSFENAIKNTNEKNKRNNDKMENTTAKDLVKETVKGELASVVEQLTNIFDEKFKNLQDSIKTATAEASAAVIDDVKEVSKSSDEAVKSADVVDNSANDKIIGALNSLNDTIKQMQEKNEKMVAAASVKKGIEQPYEDEDAADTVKKTLKGPSDVDTLKFVFRAMEDESLYEGLTDKEKALTDSIYFSAYSAAFSNKG